MLNALQKQLKLLAADPNDPFSGSIRKLVGPREAVMYEQPLRAMILAMPAMIWQIRAWVAESNISPSLSRLHGFAMAYLYSPEDFLPESSMGLFGYLDDAYLVARVYHRTLLEPDSFGAGRFPGSESLPRDTHDWIRLARQILPKETSAIDKMLEEVFTRHSGNFSEMLAAAAAAGGAPGRVRKGVMDRLR